MDFIDILLALLIGGLATGIMLFVVLTPTDAGARKREALQQARMDARVIHPVAEKYHVEHPKEACPTVELLRDAYELDATSKIIDPWGSRYPILCADEDLVVISLGPDKKQGTTDDIRVPDTNP